MNLFHRLRNRVSGFGKVARTGTANRWREQYDPLRGLTLEAATALLEAYQRGQMADLQWTYFFIERTDPDLFALIERRTSALLELDWNIKMSEELIAAQGFPQPDTATREGALAAEQQAALREAYDRIDNLYEAIEHLAMATFRGFAHLEKQRDASGAVTHLEILDQWNVVRDGLRGAWKYNPDARTTSFQNLPDNLLLDPAQWIIREVMRHVNRIGLMKHVRSGLAQKDWDDYVNIYGLPGAVVVGPPGVAPEQESAFESQAEAISDGKCSYLPNGASVQFYNGPRLTSPFGEYLRYLTEQLVLAGTGGVLTMLANSGTGTLAGSVHAKTFQQIARSEARKISETFQKQFDTEILGAAFPGAPRLAYFELAADEQADTSVAVDQALKLNQAGFLLDAAELSEKTGYRLTARGAVGR